MNRAVAIRRRRLSRPLRAALAAGVVTRGQSYFDYGSGRGDDVRLLRRREWKAAGWDPNHSPRSPKKASDVVGVVYVLNILPSVKERAEVLRSAAALAKRRLLIAVRTDKAPGKRYRDGVVTSAGTFQRNYRPGELVKFVSSTLGLVAAELEPGVVVVDVSRSTPVKPNKTRKISQKCRRFYAGDRSKIPLSHFAERDRDYPYRNAAGRIDCNLVSAGIKRARLNKGRGVRGSAATMKKLQTIWNRVCAKYTDGASQ